MTEKVEAEFRGFVDGPEGDTEVLTNYVLSNDEFTLTVSCSKVVVFAYDDVHATTHTTDLTVECSKEVLLSPLFDLYRNSLLELQSRAGEFGESEWRNLIEILVAHSTAWRLADSSVTQEWEQIFATGEGQYFTSEVHHFLGFNGSEISYEMANHINTSGLDEREYDLVTTDVSDLKSILAAVNCDNIVSLWLELDDRQVNIWDSISEWMSKNSQSDGK